MLLVCAAILFSCTAVCSDADFTTYNMLNILRDKLQIGNDDYKDKLRDGPEATMKGADEFLQSPHHRRMNDEPPAPGAAPSNNDVAPADDADAAPADTDERTTTASAEPGATRNPKYIKKALQVDRKKVKKLRNFLDKYKVIVNEFMDNRSASPAQDSAGPAARPGSRPARGASASREEAPGLRARGEPAGPDHRPPASASQLDMAPARGGIVYSLRAKNRLCHRNVMIPEGPKYNSKGHVYLAEFETVHGREYPQTVAPRLLLPKCCNCCRKSVLGCE